MDRFFILGLIAASFLSGCIGQPYIYGNNPGVGYDYGYALGAGFFTGKQPVILPNYLVQAVSPEHRRYAERAGSEPGWYTCNGWVYTPQGEAAYYASQSAKTDHLTGQLRLTDTPPRPRLKDTDGYGRLIYPDPCFHVRNQK